MALLGFHFFITSREQAGSQFYTGKGGRGWTVVLSADKALLLSKTDIDSVSFVYRHDRSL
jgi:hypothetical protein